MLNETAQKELLSIARKTLESFLRGDNTTSIQTSLPTLQQKTGAFVTLHYHGELRGCIGHLVSNIPLFETVKEVAIAAATQDYRFLPLTSKELEEVQIEISVLTPFQEIKNINEIEVGKHGLLITQNQHRGLLLPQVATEYGWNREEFLTQTCLKAGLPENAYQEKDCKIEVFSAQVFGE